jgi:hypothetical protein
MTAILESSVGKVKMNYMHSIDFCKIKIYILQQ